LVLLESLDIFKWELNSLLFHIPPQKIRMEAHAKFAVLWHLTRDLHINKSSFARSFDRLVTLYIRLCNQMSSCWLFLNPLCRLAKVGNKNLQILWCKIYLLFENPSYIEMQGSVTYPPDFLTVSGVPSAPSLHWTTLYQVPIICQAPFYVPGIQKWAWPSWVCVHIWWNYI
jgi:hypothetical protein